MGLITGLVSTVVHAAAGRNPYGHNHNNQSSVTTPGGGAAPGSAAGPHEGHNHTGPDGQPCGICKVALPFGKGREAKRERRAARDERKAVIYAMRAQQRGGRRGRYGYDTAGFMGVAGPYQQQPPQQQGYFNNNASNNMSRGGPSSGQEEGVGERRRASTGDDVPPPAYSAAGPSSLNVGVEASRSVEVLGNGDEKERQEKD
ncbi:uncharacterized protein BDZ83DRAFT_55786 [Colletotrichum acutatum]|uniref:Uncharacterized protein n=1 Tax=Glomerella acutata TaxID=27357 RepID=A0AAD8UC73_GLOAC|nr:uncharacterized protein BDZ83DRAFT_55786 [Colletotrichum acutatum]KAK1715548.1 hypothetical protein BDZ83DRAFT_55786 [Colletotrichum acutatum]